MQKIYLPVEKAKEIYQEVKMQYQALAKTKKTEKEIARIKKTHDFFKNLTESEPIPFYQIRIYCDQYRDKLSKISYFLDLPDRYPTEEIIDLTDECIALQIDGDIIAKVLPIYQNFIALMGLDRNHITFSLVGADKDDSTRISSDYRNAYVYGIETWPSRGVLGMTRDYNDVLDCS